MARHVISKDFTYAGLVQHENAVQEVKVPDSRNHLQVQISSEESHEPLVHILFWLDIFNFKVFTNFW